MTIDEIKKMRLVLIDFWSPTCGPCRAMKPVLQSMEQDFPEIDFLYCNVMEEAEIAQMFQVDMLPTIMVLNNGECVYRNTGVISGDNLFEELDEIVMKCLPNKIVKNFLSETDKI